MSLSIAFLWACGWHEDKLENAILHFSIIAGNYVLVHSELTSFPNNNHSDDVRGERVLHECIIIIHVNRE